MSRHSTTQVQPVNKVDSTPVSSGILRQHGRDQYSANLQAQPFGAKPVGELGQPGMRNRPEPAPDAFAMPRFGYDFARIPLHGAALPPKETMPRLRVRNFAAGPSTGSTGFHLSERASSEQRSATDDKSLESRFEAQDRMLSSSAFAVEPPPRKGVHIEVDASTAGTTAEHAGAGAIVGLGVAGLGLGIAGLAGATLGAGLVAGALAGGAALGALVGGIVGGYRYTQTIDTNAPLGGTSSPYVDPRPNDDDKPFYYTDAEEKAFGTHFVDRPSRPAPTSGITRWDAILSITHVSGKTATILESLTYGFSLDSSGTVTPRAPTATSTVGTHVSTLSSEFPDWTFKKG
jgi:hypothetical protein